MDEAKEFFGHQRVYAAQSSLTLISYRLPFFYIKHRLGHYWSNQRITVVAERNTCVWSEPDLISIDASLSNSTLFSLSLSANVLDPPFGYQIDLILVVCGTKATTFPLIDIFVNSVANAVTVRLNTSFYWAASFWSQTGTYRHQVTWTWTCSLNFWDIKDWL